MKFKNLTERVGHYSRASQRWNRNDILLASFPKSGNTWVRYFWINYISQAEWDGRIVDFKMLDEVMPSFGLPNFFDQWEHTSLPKAVASHWNYGFYFRKPKKVLINRDPRDVMVSYFHYINGKTSQPDFDRFSDFVRTTKFGLSAWCKHYLSWSGKPQVILKYEDLKNDDVAAFSRMLETLDVKFDQTLLVKATEASRFDKFRSVENKLGHSKPNSNKDNFKFTRKGIVGDFKNYFSDSDIEYYKLTVSRFGLEKKLMDDGYFDY